MNTSDIFTLDDTGCYWVMFNGSRQVTNPSEVLAIAAALKAQGERMQARQLSRIAGKE